MTHRDQFEAFAKVKSYRLNTLPENPDKNAEDSVVSIGRFPKWLHRPLTERKLLKETRDVLASNRLHTVCEEARCPNLLECYSKKTATFLILGKECTRACGFCDINHSKTPQAIDENEPENVADSCEKLGLKHVVITMVARDDLPDGGASHLINVIRAIRKRQPSTTIELLTSDFEMNTDALQNVLLEKPEIFNHNIETVVRLSPKVRDKATFERSIDVLSFAKSNSQSLIKSGLMVGLGETKDEVFATLKILKDTGIDIVTIGQYLQASQKKLAVKRFVHPDEFQEYEHYGNQLGIPYIYAKPFVRSSYNAQVVLQDMNGKTMNITSH